MKNSVRLFVSIVLLVVLQTSAPLALACSESYITPVFDYKYAPENPYENFAAGRIGIVKPSYRRVVLFAAYRYLNNQPFSANEQKALIEVWNAEFKNQEPPANDVTETVKAWLEERKIVATDETNLPDIYAERQYGGGYAFFPNCTANAFETATETLSSRAASYGADNPDVREWLRGQDAVFANCASGQNTPAELNQTAAEWLRRDRAYQIAAAKFYSLDFDDARARFAAISEDADSPWQETADYLVGRTLVRQASFTKDETMRNRLYDEAEQRLTTRGGAKFSGAAQKLVNLIKLRTRPEERARELAQALNFQSSGDDLRQDLIDYTWLLDEFEADILKAEEKRKEEIKKQEEIKNNVSHNADNSANANVSVPLISSEANQPSPAPESNNTAETLSNNNWQEESEKRSAGETITFYIYEENKAKPEESNSQSFTFDVKTPDDEIYRAVVEKLKRELTEKDRQTIKEAREQSYQNKTSNRQISDYTADYYGVERINSALVPQSLRQDDLTDWLYAFQIQDDEAFHYSLEKWRQTHTDLWLTTALTKAGKNSTGVDDLIKAAEKIDRSAPAFPTVAYHTARIYLEQGKQALAAKLLDSILESNLDLPISTRNQFAALRQNVAETLDDFLRNATREPFTFADYESSTTIDEAIAEQKKWWDAASYKQSKADWDRETEEEFAGYKLWEHRKMFDRKTTDVMNAHFPLAVILDAQKSEKLPDYLRERLAVVVWTRAVMLDDDATLAQIAAEVARYAPEEINAYLKAKTPRAKRFAALYVVFRHGDFSPYIGDFYSHGFRMNEETNDWWCALPETFYDDAGDEIPRASLKRPAFLTARQSETAQEESKKLRALGDASTFLGEQALGWMKLAPNDGRLVSILFAAYNASEEFHYGCGNGEMHRKLGNIIINRFPSSAEAGKIAAEEQ